MAHFVSFKPSQRSGIYRRASVRFRYRQKLSHLPVPLTDLPRYDNSFSKICLFIHFSQIIYVPCYWRSGSYVLSYWSQFAFSRIYVPYYWGSIQRDIVNLVLYMNCISLSYTAVSLHLTAFRYCGSILLSSHSEDCRQAPRSAGKSDRSFLPDFFPW